MNDPQGAFSPATPQYLTLEEVMNPDITLDELLDAPWTHDGSSLRQYYRELFTDHAKA